VLANCPARSVASHFRRCLRVHSRDPLSKVVGIGQPPDHICCDAAKLRATLEEDMSVHTRALPTSFRQLTLKAIRAIVDMLSY